MESQMTSSKVRIPALDISKVVIPAGVNVITMKSGVAFRKGSRKLFLKNRSMEMNRVYKSFTKGVVVFTEEEIKRRHLGETKSCFSHIADEKQLGTIIRTVFK